MQSCCRSFLCVGSVAAFSLLQPRGDRGLWRAPLSLLTAAWCSVNHRDAGRVSAVLSLAATFYSFILPVYSLDVETRKEEKSQLWLLCFRGTVECGLFRYWWDDNALCLFRDSVTVLRGCAVRLHPRSKHLFNVLNSQESKLRMRKLKTKYQISHYNRVSSQK